MLNVGKVYNVVVKRETPLGYMVGNDRDEVFLHKNDVIEDIEVGQEIECFIFHDKQRRVTATMATPIITTENYEWVEVVGIQEKSGVFVNIGIKKDMLLSLDDLSEFRDLWPEIGDKLYCTLKVNKSGYLLAHLANRTVLFDITDEYTENTEERLPKTVVGTVYKTGKIKTNVITETGYLGYIHYLNRREEPRLGYKGEFRVVGIDEELGELQLATFAQKELVMDDDAKQVLDYMVSRGGAMPYSDKSLPEDIFRQFKMSKAAFKRALGRLYKDKKIYQEDTWTYLVEEEK